jgi:hypothetical protein
VSQSGRVDAEHPDKSDNLPSSIPLTCSVLLCISRLKPHYRRTVMVAINTILVEDDEALFKALRTAYRQEIGIFQWWFSMRTIIGIRFVHVSKPFAFMIRITAN